VKEEVHSCRFRPKERLKGRNAVKEVFSRGKRYECPGAKLFVLKNGLFCNRICFTFPKKFGNAVERNRARRLGREAYRLLRPWLQGGHDLVLLVYPLREGEEKPGLSSRMEQLEYLFGRSALFMGKPECRSSGR
jgi:ribonuclease P protein component